jgi:hypothetical protein
LLVHAQSDMRVYTVAGNLTSTALGDGGPATAAQLGNTEGIWMDGTHNLYISTLDNRVRKVSAASGIITTIAGTGVSGFSGDGGPATDATIHNPYGIYADAVGNVYFTDASNHRVRKIDAATGIISTIAGGGTSVGDGGPATDAVLTYPYNVFQDEKGNIYIGEDARIRKLDTATGTITTIAGTGIHGFSGDGGPATNAQLRAASGIAFDKKGNFIFADRANHRIRKIDTNGIITSIVGTSNGYSGDGGLATNAQIYGPIGIAIDSIDNIIIADNGNNFIRKVNAKTGVITTIAGVGNGTTGDITEGAPPLTADIHPEFIYLENSGIIYYSNFGAQVRKITNYNPLFGLGIRKTEDIGASKVSIHPNPATDELTINVDVAGYSSCTITNSMGRVLLQQQLSTPQTKIDISHLPAGLYYITARGSSGVKTLRFVRM